ncbi:hypothetical protein LTR56_010720 [Elasticomyces elasticus]|nr:hypothetical protein LTR56_010720 [Elasticomyces elasticus]KAK3655346.1 hypothetical protein LTR22_010231 [Elasticomyces elasticus]KAK4922080.1 hypothetical protein LTR49_010491 [Elasticomyces elasticus]KAK5750985.1 hypothetical protein LTS12_018975 [Elasticomyces elasticus]
MSTHILLKNGTVLLHDAQDHVTATKTDVLISDSIISKIEPNISDGNIEAGTEVIDCTDKLISPGFVDTHHHVWQSQLKGRHANQGLMQYMASGRLLSNVFNAEDVFWGQLGGCMEMIDGGTTTVVDYAHGCHGKESNEAAISATASSGIRSIYCYSPPLTVTSWDPFTLDQNSLTEDVFTILSSLAKASPFADGRVSIGFAFDAFHFLPQQYLDMLMASLASIPLITLHYCFGPTGNFSIPQAIESKGYLDGRFLIAHSTNMPKEDVALYHKRGVHLSSTPSTEMQMSMGGPVACFIENYEGQNVRELCSLGVDCHSNNSAYLPGEASLALQSARGYRSQVFLDAGKQTKSAGDYTVEEAYNQATIRGARAAKMGDSTGSIAVGKRADLVIFDATSPAMICGAAKDPVAAIVLHSSPADIELVIVDGVVRKRGGKLLSVGLDDNGKKIAGRRSGLAWREVAKELLASQEKLEKKLVGIDFGKAEVGLMEAWHIDPATVVDSI